MDVADRQTRQVVAGSAIIGIIAGLAVLIFLLEDIRDAFRRTYRIVALFPETPDLVVDAPVWVAGKPVGRVTHVGLLPTGFDTIPIVAVEMKLLRTSQAQVRSDSYARLTSPQLIGERVVDIMPGSAEAPVLGHGDTVGVRLPRRHAELMARRDTFMTELDSLIALVDRIRAPLARRAADLAPVGRELALVQQEATALAHTIREGPAGSALRADGLRAAVARAAANVAEIGPAIQRAIGTTEGTGQELRSAADSLLLRFDQLQASLTAIEREMETGEGFIGRIAVDTAIHVAMDNTGVELDSLIAQVRRNPFRFFRLRLW
jgi:phospholipid/cholesterol/gamma-HCH transport system substrate-binding protein